MENKINDEVLEQVTGGRVWGYSPNSPCPHCGTPLVFEEKVNDEKRKSRCPGCGDFFFYGYF